MKKHKINCFKVVMVLFFIVSSPLKTFAQDWDDGPDPPPAPIDDYIYPAIVIALIAVLYFFYKKEYSVQKPLKQK